VVEYRYDAYGNCTVANSTTDYALATVNPIRYRGYYFDQESGLYFLNARYYSPEWRRFISPDDTAYLDPESVNGLNLYCYCNNDPVNYADPSGHLAFWIITALIGAAIGVGVTAAIDYIPDQEFNLHWGSYVGAGVAGALIGAGIGMAISYSATGTLTASFTDIRFGYALKAAQNGNYNKLAKFGTHNNRSKQVGLGKYIEGSPNSYEVLSRKFGYTYYEMKPSYWNKMFEVLIDNVWNVNQAFLDQQLSLGKTFVQLSTDYSGYYLKELVYLGLL
jgi:RHS repeat-associated protein